MRRIRSDTPEDRFIDRDEFQRALEMAACEEILEIIARNNRCLEAWDKYRQESRTQRCDLTSANWILEKRSELDDAWSYTVLEEMRRERGL